MGVAESGHQETDLGGRGGSGRRRRHQRNKSHGGVIAYVSSTSPKHSPVVDRRVSMGRIIHMNVLYFTLIEDEKDIEICIILLVFIYWASYIV